MDLALVVVIQILYAVASLLIISSGLAVIFGMMKVINLAHGEFLMLGAYATIGAIKLGINLWIAIFLVAPVAVGLVGIVLERLVIRRLYGRMVDTMLATWGLSLLLVGIVTSLVGNTTAGVSTPLGNFAIGSYRVSVYTLVIIVVAIVLALGLRWVLTRTQWGLIARGTMQNPAMADALGISPSRVYSVTFASGAALSGLAGGLLAPLTGVVRKVAAWLMAPNRLEAPTSPASSAGPPPMTVMKALATKAPPMVGTTPVSGATSPPASPESAAPLAKVTE